MTPLDQTASIFLFAKKLFGFKNGALAVMALPGSYGITTLLKAVLQDAPIKAIVMPFLLAAFLFLVYGLVFLMDLKSGLQASKQESKGTEGRWFHSGKAWSSLFKMFVVFTIVLVPAFFSAFCALYGLDYAPWVFMIGEGVLGFMAILYDLYSIGENQERITGKKPRISIFIEKIGALIETEIFERIKAAFNLLKPKA